MEKYSFYIYVYNVKKKKASLNAWNSEFEDGQRTAIGNRWQVVSSNIHGVNDYSDQPFARETNNH